MTFWFEELERLRKEQKSETYRPMIQLELPLAPYEPRREKSESNRGVIIIGNDDEDSEGIITI